MNRRACIVVALIVGVLTGCGHIRIRETREIELLSHHPKRPPTNAVHYHVHIYLETNTPTNTP